MSIDDLTKLIFILTISISILLIAFQFSRILGKAADILQDLRKSIKNVGFFTDQLLEDYKLLSTGIKGIAGFLTHFNDNILNPAKNMFSFVGKFTKRFGGNKEEEEIEEELSDI